MNPLPQSRTTKDRRLHAAVESPEALAEFIKQLPAADHATGYRMCQGLMAGGPATIHRLVTMVGDRFGDPESIRAKYALHGLVAYAARPGAEKDRAVLTETVVQELKENHSDELKAFLIRQLQWCGREQEVSALTPFLASDRLCEPATQALIAIGGSNARTALRMALPKAAGKRRVTIVKALGKLRDQPSARAIHPGLEDNDRDVRLVSLYALGNMGDHESIPSLLNAAAGPPSYERDQATDAALLLGRRLAASKRLKDAERIFRRIMKIRQAPEDFHHRAAALNGLAETIGVKAVPDVMDALSSLTLSYCAAAARTALDLASAIHKDRPAEAEKLLKKICKATRERAVIQKAEILLGARTGVRS